MLVPAMAASQGNAKLNKLPAQPGKTWIPLKSFINLSFVEFSAGLAGFSDQMLEFSQSYTVSSNQSNSADSVVFENKIIV